MRDLVKLSQRISQIVPDDKKTIQQTYSFLTTDPFCVTGLKHLSPFEIVKICFLVYETKKRNIDPNFLLSELENMFLFSTIYFSGEIRHSCYECGGDGYTRCGECDGGEISCDNCDGEGTIKGSDEEGDDECGQCDGTGTIDCQECDEGYVNCDYCDGNGEVTDDGLEYTINTFISYSNKLKRIIKNSHDTMQSLSLKMVDSLTDNYKTIILRELDSEDNNVDSGWEGKTYINKVKESGDTDGLEMSINGSRGITIYEDDLEEVSKEF